MQTATTDSSAENDIPTVSDLSDFFLLSYLLPYHFYSAWIAWRLGLMDFQLGKCNIQSYQKQVSSGVQLLEGFTYHTLIIEISTRLPSSPSDRLSVLIRSKVSWNSIRKENKGHSESESSLPWYFSVMFLNCLCEWAWMHKFFVLLQTTLVITDPLQHNPLRKGLKDIIKGILTMQLLTILTISEHLKYTHIIYLSIHYSCIYIKYIKTVYIFSCRHQRYWSYSICVWLFVDLNKFDTFLI